MIGGKRKRRELFETSRHDRRARQERGTMMSIDPRWFLERHDFHDTFISKESLG
jgi:hypothetical protein